MAFGDPPDYFGKYSSSRPFFPEPTRTCEDCNVEGFYALPVPGQDERICCARHYDRRRGIEGKSLLTEPQESKTTQERIPDYVPGPTVVSKEKRLEDALNEALGQLNVTGQGFVVELIKRLYSL